ncbi:hypothetical protein BOX15_Mlig001478g3, partial [Macrostomum lignano]
FSNDPNHHKFTHCSVKKTITSAGPPPRYSASTVGASGPAGGDRKSSRGSSRSSAKSKTAGDGKKSKAAK